MNWHPTHSYDVKFKQELDALLPGLSCDFSRVIELSGPTADHLVARVLELSCQCQNSRNIVLGRDVATNLPRKWLLDRIEIVAEQTLDLSNDDWEYRRLLELSELLDPDFLARLICRGLTSHNPEIVEAANDFQPPKYA